MRYTLVFFIMLVIVSCNSSGAKIAHTKASKSTKLNSSSNFSGDYSKTFDDLPDLHIAAAEAKGVSPLTLRADTVKYSKQLVRIPNEIEIYKTDKLDHSIPFLVKDASSLLTLICSSFRDSLVSKKLPLYKPIITSIMRTDDDVEILRKRNSNAVENSAHRYGTTFDISWKRFECTTTKMDDVYDLKLKLVLAQVLNDLRQQSKCYVKYERKQACFHITVR